MTACILGCAQCDALNGLYIATMGIFALSCMLLMGKLYVALENARIGTRRLAAVRAKGVVMELPPDSPLANLLDDPLTQRAVGLAEASAVAAFFVPLLMTNEEVLRVEEVEERFRVGGMLSRMVGAHRVRRIFGCHRNNPSSAFRERKPSPRIHLLASE